ncbi:MAG: LysM peptidoglycan-binding domain-containing protein [candidate division SR1 bacterium]|nr:LysM peptidoglycan-binding domain-containing protein [candidate division SR1 bacterium]
MNYFKFVLSLCFIVFFIFVIANANLFENNQEQLAINSSFIQGDDGVSYEINLDNVNVNVDDNNNGIIEYTVQNGDTLLKVAGVFGTTVSSIQKENNLKQNDLQAGQVLKVSNQVDGIVYTVPDKTNVLVFANKYNLNLQDLMTLNYVQDETELFTPGQEIFVNITKDKAYELGLLQKPVPIVIPKSTITYRPTINKAGKPSIKSINKIAVTTIASDDTESDDTNITKGGIISSWTYTKKIKNGFAVGYCTWYAAIISPNIFPYINETTQDRPFGGDARQWCANAKAAGLRVGSKPSVGAVIVYSRLRSSAGHVGKVINYYPDDGKMIIRDMNYVGKFVVTERRENTDNGAISCYIYGK